MVHSSCQAHRHPHCVQGKTQAAVQPIVWSGSKSESRLLQRLGLAEAARAAAAQAAAEHSQAQVRPRGRAARRTTSSDAGMTIPTASPSCTFGML